MARAIATALVLAGSAAVAPGPLAGQLPSASAHVLGLGGLATAQVRGVAAIGTNPAGLAMPRASRREIALFPFTAGAGIRPVTLGDIGEWDGRVIPDEVREAWLVRVEERGREKGAGSLQLTPLALARGFFGVQITTAGSLHADLNPDASELLLFGNAGRTGQARDFQLAGSSLDAWLVSTLAVSAGIPLDIDIGDAPGQAFAVGGTLKLTMGHGLLLGRDVGTTLAEPSGAAARFQVIQTDTTWGSLENGLGVGLDVGFQWEAGPWGAGLSVANLVQTFGWRLADLWYRPGTALFDRDRSESDFGARPASQAPASLRRSVADFGFGRTIEAGVLNRGNERLSWGGGVRARFGGRRGDGPPLEVGSTVEFLATPALPVTAHAAIVSGGGRLGGGVSWTTGRVRGSGAMSYLTSEHAIFASLSIVLLDR